MSKYKLRRKGKYGDDDSVMEILLKDDSYILYSDTDSRNAISVLKQLESGLTLIDIITNKIESECENKYGNTIKKLELNLTFARNEIDKISLQLLAKTKEQLVKNNNGSNIILPDEKKTREYATYIQKAYGESDVDSLELAGLCRELKNRNFPNHAVLKYYIMNNSLGDRYPNIIGDIKMERGGRISTMPNGIKTELYHIVCNEIGFTYVSTDAKPVGFISNLDLNR